MKTLARLAALAALGLLAASAAFAQPAPGIQKAYMDTTCSPCKDFYQYANGAWVATAEMPAAYSAIGVGREMADRNQEALRQTLESSAATWRTSKDPDLKKVGALFASLMDSARADREGAAPMKPYLDEISAIKDRKELKRVLAKWQGLGEGYPFAVFGYADLKNSGWTIGHLYQAGLGMPDRDYYTRTDSGSVKLQGDYRAHVGRMLALLGTPAAQAEKDAAAVYELENRLALASLTRVQLRDREAQYHKMAVKELQVLAPELDWVGYFTTAGITPLASPDSAVNVWQPEFIKAAVKEIETAPLDTWKAYLRYHAVRAAAPWMSQAFFDESFVYQKYFTGAREPLPRWKRAADAVDGTLGEALGKAYVAKYFGPESKRKMNELVDNLFAAYRERIKGLAWMSDDTKKQALHKLSTIRRKVGYPDKWRDYSKLQVDGEAHGLTNLIAAQEYETKRQFAKIGKPMDREEWALSPPTVNAYYNGVNNEIVFPAGILQPPMFDPNADDAYNYGGTGMVIGHEITHGFDDQGRKSDAEGNLKDWWTEEDGKRFEALADRIAKQYDGYVAIDTLHVNGKLTLGENIADRGGITIAYYAYMKSLEGKPREIKEGFTPEQRFFLGLAQAWRRKMRPERLRMLTNTDPHSPPNWRVLGPLANMKEFQQAFGCKPTDPMMLPPDRMTSIW